MFDAFLLDSAAAILTTGTTSLRLYEVQSDGTLKSYDFNDNTFKTGALTTETASMTHRTGNNSTTNTGLWTYALSTVTGFTSGRRYIAQIVNTSAVPSVQSREFQYGQADGDPIYHADIQFTRDQAATEDQYVVTWFKDGQRVSSGITSPTIQVVKYSDGTDLIASTAMTEIGSTHCFKYTATSGERQTVGAQVVVLAGGTMDGTARSWARALGRDSA